MTHEQAEQLRSDPRYWRFGIVYYCRADPSVVVRNRSFVGWSWNFGYRYVIPVIGLASLFVISPLYWIVRQDYSSIWLAGLVFLGLMAILIYIADWIALGPR